MRHAGEAELDPVDKGVASAPPLASILYVVHDTADAAVRRRIAMLEAGGATVRLAGFRRGEPQPGVAADFGPTVPARLDKRILRVFETCWHHRRYASAAAGVDLILCRNLESLLIGVLLRRLHNRKARVAYEVLDIHRAMLSEGWKGKVMRWIERRLAGSADLLLTSSPAFAREYFARINPLNLPVRLVENKVFPPVAAHRRPREAAPPGRPLRIGWFGVIRCRKSLAILRDAAALMGGRLEVDIRGKPAEHEFEDFHGTIAGSPFLTFHGPYRPQDLPDHYGEVDLVWAIDFFEQGLNSSWLLPNRLYEGCLNGAVPIAEAKVETGRWLRERQLGLLLDPVDAATLVAALRTLDPERLAALRADVEALPEATWSSSEAECRALVAELARIEQVPADVPPADRRAA